MEGHEIFESLRNDFMVARKKAAAADRKRMATIHAAPTGLPHPDGVHEIQNIVGELNSARQEMIRANARLTAFMLEGIVPDNLKKNEQRRAGDLCPVSNE
jgi:hypothetical protein